MGIMEDFSLRAGDIIKFKDPKIDYDLIIDEIISLGFQVGEFDWNIKLCGTPVVKETQEQKGGCGEIGIVKLYGLNGGKAEFHHNGGDVDEIHIFRELV